MKGMAEGNNPTIPNLGSGTENPMEVLGQTRKLGELPKSDPARIPGVLGKGGDLFSNYRARGGTQSLECQMDGAEQRMGERYETECMGKRESFIGGGACDNGDPDMHGLCPGEPGYKL